MALKAGSTQDVIDDNVGGLVAVGYTRDHACAIAEASARNYREAEAAAASRHTVGSRSTAQVFDRASFYTTQQLGKTRYLTPEGFLVIVGVPIARTGEQLYAESELNGPGEAIIKGNADGVVVVTRTPEEVFRTETLASFEGKPITVEHPTEFVTPDTYKLLAVGHMQHVRQGAGIEDDLLLCDYVITDPAAIAYVNKEFPDVSAGYTAGYVQTEPGRANCIDIVGNHSALVERGRAGPRVAIKDSHPPGETRMKLRDVVKLFIPNLATNDNAAVTAALDSDVPGISPAAVAAQPTADSAAVLAEVRKLGERLDTTDAQIKEIKDCMTKTGDEDDETEEEKKKREAKEAQDAANGAIAEQEAADTILEAESPGTVINLGKVYTGDSAGAQPDAFKEIVSRAEILSPGITIPTKDSVKGSKGAALAGFMRTVLERAATTDSGKEAVGTFLMGRKVTDLKGHELLGVYNGAANLVSARNNTRSASMTSARVGDFSRPSGIAAINEANRKFWANGGKQ